MGKHYKGSSKKKKITWVHVLAIILAVIIVMLLGVYAAIRHYYDKSNYVSDDKITINKSADVQTDSTGLSDEESSALQSEIINETKDIELPNDSNVYNLLLIGVDRRDKSWYGNSDSMILLSINKETKQIRMTSFMRDLYANIPEVGVKKLNAACAYGGGPLVEATIEDNYKIPVDNYASVDFDAMIDIVDAIGGIELSPSDDEVRVANDYINDMCKKKNTDASAHLYTTSGTQQVDGYQAVAYARIRYVGNSDYQRTERQREVLSKMMAKAKGLSVTELTALADKILPSVTHNIEQTTLLKLISEMPTILSYDMEQSRVPYDDLYSNMGEMLVPDFSATIARLQTEIYGSTTVNE